MRAKQAYLIQQSNGLYKINLGMYTMNEERKGKTYHYIDLEKEEAELIANEVNEQADQWNKEYY